MSIREKRLLVIAAVIFSLTFLLFGVQFLIVNNFFRPQRSVVMSEERKNEILVRTRELREMLKPWAKENQTLLHKMLRSSENDTSASNKVWGMSPIVLTSFDKNDSSRRIQMADTNKPVMFEILCGQSTLERVTKWEKPRNAEQQRSKVKADRILNGRRKFYWRKFRDIPLIASVNPGGEQYILWVSGRITRQSTPIGLAGLLQKNRNLVIAEVSDHQQLEQPFSFLN